MLELIATRLALAATPTPAQYGDFVEALHFAGFDVTLIEDEVDALWVAHMIAGV